MNATIEARARAEAILEPYKVVTPTMVSVCCCCFPGDSIFSLFPDLKGSELSHGICPRHAARWKADLAIQRAKADLRQHNTAYARMGGAL